MIDKKDNYLINAGCKASDVIATTPEMVQFAQLAGIPLGFGDITVGELCRRCGMSRHLFLALTNTLLYPDYEPDITRLDSNDVIAIIRYLEASHDHYRNVIMPGLHMNVHKIAAGCPEDTKSLVNCFFDEFDAEMGRHIDNEEKNLFSYIKDVASGNVHSDRQLSQFIEQHNDAEVKIDDFRNIVAKYVPESCNIPERYVAVIQMLHIASDLMFHTRIEERILFPLVSEMEAKAAEI